VLAGLQHLNDTVNRAIPCASWLVSVTRANSNLAALCSCMCCAMSLLQPVCVEDHVIAGMVLIPHNRCSCIAASSCTGSCSSSSSTSSSVPPDMSAAAADATVTAQTGQALPKLPQMTCFGSHRLVFYSCSAGPAPAVCTAAPALWLCRNSSCTCRDRFRRRSCSLCCCARHVCMYGIPYPAPMPRSSVALGSAATAALTTCAVCQ
jgi:hypothetical protein